MGTENQPGKVAVRCACGARFAVRPELLGRRARCPRCRQPVSLAPAEPAAGSALSTPESDGDRIRFTCGCGARIAVPASVAGRKVRCPKCAAALRVPAAAAIGDAPASADTLDAEELLGALASGTPLSREQVSDSGDDGLYRLSQAEPLPPPPPREPKEHQIAAGPPKTCPSCRKQLPGSAKICVDCGVDLKTGRSVLTTDETNLDSAYIYAEGIVYWLSWVFPFGIYPIASEAFGTRRPWRIRRTYATYTSLKVSGARSTAGSVFMSTA